MAMAEYGHNQGTKRGKWQDVTSFSRETNKGFVEVDDAAWRAALSIKRASLG